MGRQVTMEGGNFHPTKMLLHPPIDLTGYYRSKNTYIMMSVGLFRVIVIHVVAN